MSMREILIWIAVFACLALWFLRGEPDEWEFSESWDTRTTSVNEPIGNIVASLRITYTDIVVQEEDGTCWSVYELRRDLLARLDRIERLLLAQEEEQQGVSEP